MNYINRGESLFIPFRKGKTIADSQSKPRMYKSKEAFEKSFPCHNLGRDGVELVEYQEIGEPLEEQQPLTLAQISRSVPMIHQLKTIEPFFSDVENGSKNFEIRIHDRPFAIGDILVLQQYVDGQLTGKEVRKIVGYIITDERFVKVGYCVIGFKETVCADRWISVNLAKPNDGFIVKAKGTNGDVLEAFVNPVEWRRWEELSSGTILEGITHWQPLPKEE